MAVYTKPADPNVSLKLPSESYVPATMPGVLGTADSVTLIMLNAFWISSVPLMIVIGGTASLTYWILCGLLFFIPCVLVMAQLGNMFPHQGSFYNWTAHALGRRAAFFVALCFWIPGVISMMSAGSVFVSCVQALNPGWLSSSQSQGAVILVLLVVAGIVSVHRTRTVFGLLKGVTALMLFAVVLMVAAAVVWLVTGHHSATNFADAPSWNLVLQGPQNNLSTLSNGVLAFLGSNMALTMAGEMRADRQRSIIKHHLAWGTVLVLGGYLLITFAILTVEGTAAAQSTNNTVLIAILTVDRVFGKLAGNIVALAILSFFLAIVIALNIGYGRLFMTVAIDGSLPQRLGRLNKHRVPGNAMWLQIIIIMVVTAILFFIAPAISLGGFKPADFTNVAYNVFSASVLLVWSIAFIFPFLDVAILYVKDRAAFNQHRVVPALVLMCGVVTGIAFCILAIVITLTNSFISSLMPNQTWATVVGVFTVLILITGFIATMLATSEASWEQMRDEAVNVAPGGDGR